MPAQPGGAGLVLPCGCIGWFVRNRWSRHLREGGTGRRGGEARSRSRAALPTSLLWGFPPAPRSPRVSLLCGSSLCQSGETFQCQSRCCLRAGAPVRVGGCWPGGFCGRGRRFPLPSSPWARKVTLCSVLFEPSCAPPVKRLRCRLQLDLADLQKELEKSQSVFPENPSVWVKDLASYLNYKLQAPRSDPALSQHPHGQCCGGTGTGRGSSAGPPCPPAVPGTFGLGETPRSLGPTGGADGARRCVRCRVCPAWVSGRRLNGSSLHVRLLESWERQDQNSRRRERERSPETNCPRAGLVPCKPRPLGFAFPLSPHRKLGDKKGTRLWF